MAVYESFMDKVSRWIADRLETPSSGYKPYTPSDQQTLLACLEPGDVLLIEGNQKVSAAIKYLTQSTWSHAALYVGDALVDVETESGEPGRLIEVNLGDGCVAVPLSKYETYNTRICRAVGLSDQEKQDVVDFMVGKLGVKYDLRNIFDLMRYLLPTPPVPVRWRRRMLSIGSGEPTKAICSSLIAQAFQSIPYPILPAITLAPGCTCAKSNYSRREILHIRHYSLFTPRDFDLSPYFSIIKPTVEKGFDHRKLVWGKPQIEEETADTKARTMEDCHASDVDDK